MINATPTLPTASAQPPKDPTLAAKPAPQITPKKKSNWKVILGSLVLLLVIAGGAVGFYLTQQAGIGDTRQQAAGSCSNGSTYCGSGSGTCATGYTPAFDSNCPNQVRCNCTSGGSPRSCSTLGATCSYSGCVGGTTVISGDSCSDGTNNGVCCRSAQSSACYDLNQGCARIEDSNPIDNQGCDEGPGGGKYPAIDQCKDEQRITCCIQNTTQNNVRRGECRAAQGTEGVCAAQQDRNCYDLNNCATVIPTPANQACPVGTYDSASNEPVGARCAETVNCFLNGANQQTMRYRCLELGGMVHAGCPAGTAVKQAQSGTIFCQCNNNANLSVNPGATQADAARICGTAATPSPGTGGTGIMCPNSPTTPAKKWVKFTCPNGCTQTTENGVTAWRCYENRQDSTTELNLAPEECGQVDVLSGTTDDTYCGYKPSNYTCDQSQCQRQPSPSPTTPPQSSCASLEVLDPVSLAPVAKSSVVAGQEYRYRCVPGAGVPADYYFFTARSNTTGPLNLIYQGTSDLTFPIMTTDYLHVQCNPCVGTTCASAQNVNSSCNFEYTKTVTPGPQCLALWMASVDNPTVSLTNPKVGDRIFLGCGQVKGAARYIFKVTEPDGNVTNLGPLDVTAAPTTSQAYSITKQGRHYAQCQICTGQADSTCFPYETLPTQGQN